ncbi:MAG TPA: Gfo/Idh/MocA family oxidoreductase, partial [Acidobacteriota bacterium]|nr:Gfo/Idh/MocA family oxidoreductase [Acidobacteriota bacterium]
MNEPTKTGRPRAKSKAGVHNPKLGFVGTGWIGRSRLASIVKSEKATVCALVDTDSEMLERGSLIAPSAERLTSFTDLLQHGLDGVVLATPNALHAEQAIACLEAGCAVFCQKPLARSATEAARVINVARLQDRLLGVDLSYRFLKGLRLAKKMIASGKFGRTFVVELTFHNAYGPDKAWFYDRELAGGGCLLDLGTHLIDAGLWILNFPEIARMTSFLFCKGHPLKDVPDAVEDYANVQLELADQTILS